MPSRMPASTPMSSETGTMTTITQNISRPGRLQRLAKLLATGVRKAVEQPKSPSSTPEKVGCGRAPCRSGSAAIGLAGLSDRRPGCLRQHADPAAVADEEVVAIAVALQPAVLAPGRLARMFGLADRQLRRFGSRLTKKKTTKLRHIIVRSMTPSRRRINESIRVPPEPIHGRRPGVLHRRRAGRTRGGRSAAPAETWELRCRARRLSICSLEGLVHREAVHLSAVVPVELAPVGLDDDARILEDLLDVLHHLLALVGVGDRQRLVQLLVEVRIGHRPSRSRHRRCDRRAPAPGRRADACSTPSSTTDTWSSRSRSVEPGMTVRLILKPASRTCAAITSPGS